MTVKSIAVTLLVGAACASCGGNDPNAGASGNASRGGGKTLAGAADTTKAAKNKGQSEVRLPEAEVVREAPAEAAAVAATPGAPAVEQPRAAASPSASPAGAAGRDLSDVPPAPKEAQWTLFCARLTDPGHVETSRALKAGLIKHTGMREWYIVHESAESRLYYGYYRSISGSDDAAEVARAQADRKKIDGLVDANKQRAFKTAQFVQLAAPDPEAPPQWNIVNAPEDKVWTLIVGAYMDSTDRKKFAIDAVREARAAGEEAYYYHGENISNVLIGTWPADAIAEERVDDAAGVNKFRDPVFVLPPGVQPPALKNMRDKEGRGVRVVGQRFVVADPSLQAKIKQYPNLGMNGDFLVVKRDGKTSLEPSRVTPIPRPSEMNFREAPNDAAGPGVVDGRGLDAADPFSRPGVVDSAAAREGRAPRQPAKAGANDGGRLRSIGDQ